MLFVSNARHFGQSFVNLPLLFGNFLVHGRDRAIQNVFLFLDAFFLINGDDFIRDIGRFLRIGAKDTDLEKIGVSHLIDLQLVAQHLISLLARGSNAVLRPFVLQLHVLNHRIENAGALNDLKNCGSQLRIMDGLIQIASEHARIFGRRFYLHENGGLILARLKIGYDRRCNQNEQECEQDEDPAHADDAPVI